MNKNLLTCQECGEKFSFESHEHICKTPILSMNKEKLTPEQDAQIRAMDTLYCPNCLYESVKWFDMPCCPVCKSKLEVIHGKPKN